MSKPSTTKRGQQGQPNGKRTQPVQSTSKRTQPAQPTSKRTQPVQAATNRDQRTQPDTKRDLRRETRREQFQRLQEDRRRVRLRARRRQQIRTYSIAGAAVAVVGILVWFLVAMLTAPHPKPGQAPANGNTVDNIPCVSGEALATHYHADLQIYLNGQPQQLPAGAGIVEPDDPSSGPHLASNGSTACLYYLHTHDTSGIVHIESPDNRTYTLGNFFDIWGQQLSTTKVMGQPVNASHKLVVEIFDANGKMTTYTGNPAQIQLSAHETIALLYNSPSVKPGPYTNWNGL